MKVVLRKASVGTKKGKFQLSNNRIWLKRPKYRPKTSHQLPELRRGRISGHLDFPAHEQFWPDPTQRRLVSLSPAMVA